MFCSHRACARRVVFSPSLRERSLVSVKVLRNRLSLERPRQVTPEDLRGG